MSYYKLGLASISASASASDRKPSLYQRGLIVGIIPGYASMGETLRAMQLLGGEIKAANVEMFLAKVSDAKTREADPDFAAFWLGPWSDFVARWSKFYSNNSGWRDRFFDTNDIFNQTQRFRKEYIGFRDQAEKLGFQWRSPDPTTPETEKHGLLDAGRRGVTKIGDGIEAILWTIAKFTLIGGALFLAFMLISQHLKG